MYSPIFIQVFLVLHVFVKIHAFPEVPSDLGEGHHDQISEVLVERNASMLGNPGLSTRAGCNCGQRNYQGTNRILAGSTAQENEFPWRCYIRMGSSGFCGCTLISNWWVMTAAHCIGGSGPATVILGDHTIGTGPPVTIIQSNKIVVHPNYNRRTLQNDIALIELSEWVGPSEKVSPACLPWHLSSNEITPWRHVVTSGWGVTSTSSTGSHSLQKVDMSLINFQTCGRSYRNMLHGDMICAGGSRGEAICRGDSGGSLDMWHNGRYYAIGVSSWGAQGCRGYSVFSRVTTFLSWIQQTTGDTYCKI